MRGDFDLIKNFDQLILSVIFFLIAAAIFLNGKCGRRNCGRND